MALSYGFYNSINSDRTYDAIQFGQIFDGIIKDGIYATYEKAMVVIASENPSEVIIQPGRAWFNHTWSYNDANFVMTAPNPNTLLERIDALVLDINTELAARENKFVWVEGEPSSRPERPTLTNTVTHHQYPLCFVHRYPETTMIYTRDITNAVGTSECPYVTGVLEGLDIDSWINQWDDEFHTWENSTRTQFETWMLTQQEVYTAWFDTIRTQMEGNLSDFEAWFETIQGIIDEEAATHLQAEIDDLAAMLPAGSHIEISTTEPSLYLMNVTVEDAGGHSKTVRFDSYGNAAIESFPYVGMLTVTSTDGTRTATGHLTTPYFGRYSIPLAFWSATVNIIGDEDMGGSVVTVKNSLGAPIYTLTLDSYGMGVYMATDPDTYTFSITYGGETMEVSLAVTQETTYEVELHGGFRFDQWLVAGRVEEEFDTLDEILADEPTLRQLFLVHDSVDYICNTFSESATSALADITKIFNTDLAAKWINLSDYALDYFGAVPGIKSIMDTADKYGYGEWTLMPQVPKMTSATAPYGVVSASGSVASSSNVWNAFDGNPSTATMLATASADAYIQYQFVQPVKIDAFMYYFTAGSPEDTELDILYSDDGTTFISVGETYIYDAEHDGGTKKIYEIPSSVGSHLYWRLRRIRTTAIQTIAYEVQFYTWQPKGNVPAMTSDTAPYGTVSVSTNQSGYQGYKAFDNDDDTRWTPTAGKTNNFIQYKSTSPVCVKKAVYVSASAANAPERELKLQASNDGTTWVDLGSVTLVPTANVITKFYVECSNNTTYYLYHRFFAEGTLHVSDSWAYSARAIQFYGRELKVSVPVMTSDTAPYGEVITDPSYTYSTTSKPYMAFDGSTSTNAGATPARIIASIGYAFTSKVNVRKVYVYTSINDQPNITYQIQYSDDRNTWTDASLAVNTTNAFIDIYDNIGDHKYWRIVRNSNASDIQTIVHEANFYGLDYSEKEFEVGTTKKWLYDHGLELEPILTRNGSNASATIQKDYSHVTCYPGSSSSASYSFIYVVTDLTSYSYMRGKLGKSATTKTTLMAQTTDFVSSLATNSSLVPNYAPYNCSLSVTSVNQTCAVQFGGGTGTSGKVEITEFWLE